MSDPMFASIPPPDDLTEPCLRCGRSVPAAAVSCPACGYTVDRHNHWRVILGSLGTVMTCSVVLAPLGIPLLWLADWHRRRAAGTVTATTTEPVTGHLRGLARHYLSLDPLAGATADFTRGGSSAWIGRPPEL